MKLLFTSPDEPRSRGLINAIEDQHEITGIGELPGDLDAVIAGTDTTNEESLLTQAQSMGVVIWSVPELVYRLCEDKQRIVIAGSKGKSELITYLRHVLDAINKEFDYCLEDEAVISEAPFIIIDGSANQCTGYDKVPQFLKYNHHIALITALEHQHEDLYPSFESYVREFDRLADSTPKGGSLIYCEDDDLVTVIGGKERADVKSIPYTAHNGNANLGGALMLLQRLSVTDPQIEKAMETYPTS